MSEVAGPSKDSLDGMEEHNNQDKTDTMRNVTAPSQPRRQIVTMGADLCHEEIHMTDMMRTASAPPTCGNSGMEEHNNQDKTMTEEEYQNLVGEKQWIPEHIMKRECIKFIPNEIDSAICHCGYKESEHSKKEENKKSEHSKKEGFKESEHSKKEGIKESEHSKKEGINAHPWNEMDCTTTSSTDAFGEITWGDRTSKYIRVDHNTDMDLMSDLLYHYWMVQEPMLIISVTGGSSNLVKKPKLIQDFTSGLLKAAETTSAFIITDGMHAGVTRHVGEALREHRIVHRTKNPIDNLGIANWGLVANKEHLKNMITLEVILEQKTNDPTRSLRRPAAMFTQFDLFPLAGVRG